MARLVCLICIALGACTPLVRYGDIEREPGQRTLVEVRVKPTDRAIPEDVAQATGQGALRRLMLTPIARVPSSEVASEMSAKVQGSEVPAIEAELDLGELGTDARRVEAMYAARGYFQAHLEDSTVIDRGNGQMRFEVGIAEGAPTLVNEVAFAGITPSIDDVEMNQRLADIERGLPEVAKLAKGDVWTEERYLASLSAIQSEFRNRGFIHATVTGDNFVSRDKNLAAIRFDIDHGPLVRADGQALITGNDYVSKARIRRRVVINDGDVLEASALRETEQQVYDLGPFFSVQVRAVRSEGVLGVQASEEAPPAKDESDDEDEPVGAELPKRVPIEVKVTQAPRWDLTLGPAVITDSAKLELGLPVTFTHRAILGQVGALRASVKPALVLPDLKCCDKVQFGLLAKLGVDLPSFFDEFLHFTSQVSFELDPTAPKKEEIGARIGVSRRLGSGFSLNLSYDLSQVFYFPDSPLEKLDSDTAIRVSDFRFRDNDRVMWLGASLVFDRRDGIYDARRGAYAMLAIDGGHEALGSTVRFLRTTLEARGYVTLDAVPWLTVAVRAKAGMTFFPQSQGTPESLRFESGGPNAHRGFRTDRMGDYVCTTEAATGQIGSDFSGTNPTCASGATERIYIGGNFVFEANVELRIQPGALGFVVFMDAGRVWSRFDAIDFRDLFVAVGPGLRLTTPVGPLRFDIGLLLGRDRDRVIHFSLGQAF